MNEDDFNDQRCQDLSASIHDTSPRYKIDDPNRPLGDDGILDQLENVKSNSCDEDKELLCKKFKGDKDEIAADDHDIEPDQQSSTSTDVAANNKCGKSYTCPVSWKSFTTSSSLKRHQITHTEERNFHRG